MKTINLSNLSGKAYIGRENGETARKRFNIDTEETENTTFEILVPSNTMAINSSFILGFLSKSIMRYDNKEAFYKIFNFKNAERFMPKIDDAVMHVMLAKKRVRNK